MKHNSFAKCIIAGEHSVLRGGRALALPLVNCNLQMEFLESRDDKPLSVSFEGIRGEELRIPFLVAMERALELVGKTKKDLKGELRINNQIPVGSGLGASAAFCVSVVKLFSYLNWIDQSEEFHYAREIENLFHGESSGLDIAVTLKAKPILYHRQEGMQDLDFKWKPNLYLSYSGNRGLTSDCIAKVKKMFEEHPNMAEKVDEKMKAAVNQVLKAMLETHNDLDLKEGLDLGLSCFNDWNLVNANLREHMHILKEHGALAMKPTGSGDGGYVLSLWPEGRSPSGSDFISVF